jgi:hypothetical protein
MERPRRASKGHERAGVCPGARCRYAAPQHVAKTLRYDVIEAEKGRVVVTVEPSEDHLNPYGGQSAKRRPRADPRDKPNQSL